MRLLRAVGLFDVAIIILIAIGVLMPAREMYASPAIKGEAQQFAVGAQAPGCIRTCIQPILDG